MGFYLEGREYYRFENVEHFIDTTCSEALVKSSLQKAEPGDLLLVRTPGYGYAFGRALAKNAYDHIAVVLNEGKTLNIVLPKTVILPITLFAKPEKKPLLLRPQWQDNEQPQRFVSEILRYSETPYDLRKTLIGIVTLALYTWLGIKSTMKKPTRSTSRWICTEAILETLKKVFPGFHRIDDIRLDYNTLGFATTNDFFRISTHFPQLLQIFTY